MNLDLASEAALGRAAGSCGGAWREAGLDHLVIGLSGDLGAGKTSWVRALLRQLGHTGRVPSPTYTLLERYVLDGITIVHLDLYRLAAPDELEFLGLRDWLAEPDTWLLAEWPERGGSWAGTLDLIIEFAITGADSRRLRFVPHTAAGRAAVDCIAGKNFN